MWGSSMAGFLEMSVVGGEGGFLGADGVNPIEALLLVGWSDRQWIEPHYFHRSLKPIGKVRVLIPATPEAPELLIDSCIAFLPRYFRSCPSFREVASELEGATRLDFHMHSDQIPGSWNRLREEARPIFESINIWSAKLTPVRGNQ